MANRFLQHLVPALYCFRESMAPDLRGKTSLQSLASWLTQQAARQLQSSTVWLTDRHSGICMESSFSTHGARRGAACPSGWTMTKATASILERFDNHHLRRICPSRRQADEPWVWYMKRATARAHSFRRSYCLRSILEQAFCAQHRWLGRLARTTMTQTLAAHALF
eukprot:11539139-Karenia_brevis.AAC.1